MSALITIFKNELAGQDLLLSRLKHLSNETREMEDALVFSVRAGMLMSFLHLLNETHIEYGTHFSRDINWPEDSLQQKPA